MYDHLHFQAFPENDLPPGFRGIRRQADRPWGLFLVSKDDILHLGWFSNEQNALAGASRFQGRSRWRRTDAETIAWIESHNEARMQSFGTGGR